MVDASRIIFTEMVMPDNESLICFQPFLFEWKKG
jgi:hypothetical protein